MTSTFHRFTSCFTWNQPYEPSNNARSAWSHVQKHHHLLIRWHQIAQNISKPFKILEWVGLDMSTSSKILDTAHVCLSVCLSVGLSIYLFIYLSIYLSIDAYIIYLFHETLVQASFQIFQGPITSITTSSLGSRPLFGGAELDRKAYQISVAWCGRSIPTPFGVCYGRFQPYPFNIVSICEFKLAFVWCESE